MSLGEWASGAVLTANRYFLKFRTGASNTFTNPTPGVVSAMEIPVGVMSWLIENLPDLVMEPNVLWPTGAVPKILPIEQGKPMIEVPYVTREVFQEELDAWFLDSFVGTDPHQAMELDTPLPPPVGGHSADNMFNRIIEIRDYHCSRLGSLEAYISTRRELPAELFLMRAKDTILSTTEEITSALWDDDDRNRQSPGERHASDETEFEAFFENERDECLIKFQMLCMDRAARRELPSGWTKIQLPGGKPIEYVYLNEDENIIQYTPPLGPATPEQEALQTSDPKGEEALQALVITCKQLALIYTGVEHDGDCNEIQKALNDYFDLLGAAEDNPEILAALLKPARDASRVRYEARGVMVAGLRQNVEDLHATYNQVQEHFYGPNASKTSLADEVRKVLEKPTTG